jgi:hypothetical protein
VKGAVRSAEEDGLDDRDRSAQDDREDPGAAVMLTAASIARMVVPSLALVAAGGAALLFFGVPQVRRELPVEAGATAASRSTVGAASLAAPHRSSDAGDEFTPVFDIARIDPTGDAVIAGRAAPSASVELLRNGYVHDRAVADRSGQFVMVPPPLPPGDYELTLRSRQPDGKEATSKRSVVVSRPSRCLCRWSPSSAHQGPLARLACPRSPSSEHSGR